jgi:hypothetical protein
MNDTAPANEPQAASPLRWLWIGVAVLMLVSLALWAQFGGVVFFNMLATAWAYCF